MRVLGGQLERKRLVSDAGCLIDRGPEQIGKLVQAGRAHIVPGLKADEGVSLSSSTWNVLSIEIR